MKQLLRTVLILFVATGRGSAQSVDIDFDAIRLSRVVTAVRITEPITLDGRLEEAVWKQATPATDFFQRLSHNGAPSLERTEARFLYDAENLYVGVSCFDSDPARLLIRDQQQQCSQRGF